MPSYKDQIPASVFKLNLMIVPDEEDDGGNFSFQEPDQVLVSQAATMQGDHGRVSLYFMYFKVLCIMGLFCVAHVTRQSGDFHGVGQNNGGFFYYALAFRGFCVQYILPVNRDMYYMPGEFYSR